MMMMMIFWVPALTSLHGAKTQENIISGEKCSAELYKQQFQTM
jgi:hypothetical protein